MSNRRFLRRVMPVAVMALGASLLLQSGAGATTTPVGLGTATSFAVLAGAGITNTGPTTVTGDTGTFPTPAETGFYGPAPSFVTFVPGGIDHADDAVTQGAKADLLTAYGDAAGRLPVISHAVELGGSVLTPGVYGNGTFGLTGTLTLDFQNDLTASFVFKTATTLITASDSHIILVNADANAACRVTWKVGSSATFGTRTQFLGDVLVKDDITANTGATFVGRLLARDGAVTLDTNTIDRGSCVTLAATPRTGGGNGGGSPAVETTSTTSPATTTTTSITVLPDTTPSVTSPTAEASATAASPAPPATLRSGGSPFGGPVPQSPPSRTSNRPELPRTGVDPFGMASVGVALISAGAILLASDRRRRPVTNRGC